ncbi:hypothetical protein FV222_00280 [Methylobacterium sp. WL103]|uniref:hypothetical protein n=1 Tax=Methylobacterium sp. WL103 TaxID=2603891 RepID=UPI0011C80C00|nr:hypothetical protein [Methylobacterium sp. WL103]TXN08942.1 hypothetical protein FV222_00280 [Methylobacterium sp. WL103]
MAIFYGSDDRSDVKIDVWKMDGTKAYLRHFDNFLTLDFIAKESKVTRERAQARSEMEICQRKLLFWKKHPRYDHDEAVKGASKLKAMWEKR